MSEGRSIRWKRNPDRLKRSRGIEMRMEDLWFDSFSRNSGKT
jgi:hypothetical protein